MLVSKDQLKQKLPKAIPTRGGKWINICKFPIEDLKSKTLFFVYLPSSFKKFKTKIIYL